MGKKLRDILNETGIISTFTKNGFTYKVSSDGNHEFSYNDFAFTFYKSKNDANIIYCQELITYKYGNIFPGLEYQYSIEMMDQLAEKFENIYIPILKKLKSIMDLSFSEIHEYLIKEMCNLNYEYCEEYSGEKEIDIDNDGDVSEYHVFAFAKENKIARVLIDKIDNDILIDLSYIEERENRKKIGTSWRNCMSPFSSNYDLLDGLVLWLKNNENTI